MSPSDDHFAGAGALEHIAERRAAGIQASAECHGTESPGHIASLTDAARETTVVLLLLSLLLEQLRLPTNHLLLILGLFGFGYVVWKVGRAGWLGWSRLERFHRVIEEERFEIEHNRSQEREELGALYAAKGFEGRLLEEVLDVLMADNDRLLKVMLEEELGFTLQAYEHPLKQALAAGIGVLSALALFAFGALFPPYGVVAMSGVALASAGFLSAYREKNRLLPAVVWNLALATLSVGGAYFILQFALRVIGPFIGSGL